MKSLSRSLAVVAAIAIGIAWQWNSYSATPVLQQAPPSPPGAMPASNLHVFEFAVSVIATDPAKDLLNSSKSMQVLSNGRIHPFLNDNETGDIPKSIKIEHVQDNAFMITIDAKQYNSIVGVGEFFAINYSAQYIVAGVEIGPFGIYGGGTFPIDPDGKSPKAKIVALARPDYDQTNKSCLFTIEILVDRVSIQFANKSLDNLKQGDNISIEVSGYSSLARRGSRRVQYWPTQDPSKLESDFMIKESYGTDYEPYFVIAPEYPSSDPSFGESEVMIKYGPFTDYFKVTWR